MRKHSYSSQDAYNEYVLNDEIPTCKCGCGEVPTYKGFTKGYNEWMRGHIARVENNWGHNKQAIQNSAQTRREQFKNGERKVWNDGLTKETDERVANYGLRGSKAIRENEEEIKRRSEWLSNARKSVPEFRSKYGKNSANWKGGSSSINNIIRANKRLYENWKYPILKNNGFKCSDCNSTKNLEVHHDKETMSEIIQKFVDINKEYNWKEKREIMNEVINYHIDNNISGKVLCKECHKKLHPSYNY